MFRRFLLCSIFAGLLACQTRPETKELRLGYLANLTHAQALIGTGDGSFQAAIGDAMRLRPVVLIAGPQAIEAIFSGQLDVAYVGPNPAINGYVKSRGRALQVVSGSANNGVVFVVQPSLADLPVEQWKGKRFGAPQIGGSQDVSIRTWFREQGLDPAAGGDITITPASGGDLLNLFQKKQLAGAWVPEPWAARLQLQAGGVPYLHEKDLWPGGSHPTTVVVASQEFIAKHPETLRKLLQVHARITGRLRQDPAAGLDQAAARIYDITHAKLPSPVLEKAFANIQFTTAVSEPALRHAAKAAAALGYLRDPDLAGMVNTTFLPR